MKILVTGCSGFIGSHLCEHLLKQEANEVIGADCNIGPTPVPLKKMNLVNLLKHPRFKYENVNLLTADLSHLLKNVEIVYHLAGTPGVRTSWGNDFQLYVENNILATQRLLEASKTLNLKKFIYASTSSVYGPKNGMVKEDMIPEPISPYGVTKLSGEQLCLVYHSNFNMPISILRYFTVYGPRQRPDMAFHRFIKQMLLKEPLTIFGDGLQSRDFTYIDDCIQGTAAVIDAKQTDGRIFNIGGKEHASVNEVIRLLEEIMNQKADIHYLAKSIGEPLHTQADISSAQTILGYTPKVTLREGLTRELQYMRKIIEMENTN